MDFAVAAGTAASTGKLSLSSTFAVRLGRPCLLYSIACTFREFVLLAGLLALTSTRENLFPIPHFASGQNDPERARHSGYESSKLL